MKLSFTQLESIICSQENIKILFPQKNNTIQTNNTQNLISRVHTPPLKMGILIFGFINTSISIKKTLIPQAEKSVIKLKIPN